MGRACAAWCHGLRPWAEVCLMGHLAVPWWTPVCISRPEQHSRAQVGAGVSCGKGCVLETVTVPAYSLRQC